MSIIGSLHSKLVYNRRMSVLADTIAKALPQGGRVLDIGCGDGKIDSLIKQHNASVSIEGIDVLMRDKTYINVTKFDGSQIPFEDNHFDISLLIDVLHHTKDPAIILKEARRVTKKYIFIKDHLREGFLAKSTLLLMDYVGNAHYGVNLTYNYLDNSQWESLFNKTGLKVEQKINKLNLYPFPANILFDRKLHFFAILNCAKG